MALSTLLLRVTVGSSLSWLSMGRNTQTSQSSLSLRFHDSKTAQVSSVFLHKPLCSMLLLRKHLLSTFDYLELCSVPKWNKRKNRIQVPVTHRKGPAGSGLIYNPSSVKYGSERIGLTGHSLAPGLRQPAQDNKTRSKARHLGSPSSLCVCPC